MASITFHGTKEIRVGKLQELDTCSAQQLVIEDMDGTSQFTLFFDHGDEAQALPTSEEVTRRVSDARLAELNDNVEEFEEEARGQLTGHIQCLYDTADEWLPSPDAAAKKVKDALEAWIDMANGCEIAEAVHRAQYHRQNLRAAAAEYERWESNEGEVAVCHALVQAFYLWGYRASNGRFFNALGAALHGLGWGQAQIAASKP
jgi:hypothetical protein